MAPKTVSARSRFPRRTRSPSRARRIRTGCRRSHAHSRQAWRAQDISRPSTAADRCEQKAHGVLPDTSDTLRSGSTVSRVVDPKSWPDVPLASVAKDRSDLRGHAALDLLRALLEFEGILCRQSPRRQQRRPVEYHAYAAPNLVVYGFEDEKSGRRGSQRTVQWLWMASQFPFGTTAGPATNVAARHRAAVRRHSALR